MKEKKKKEINALHYNLKFRSKSFLYSSSSSFSSITQLILPFNAPSCRLDSFLTAQQAERNAYLYIVFLIKKNLPPYINYTNSKMLNVTWIKWLIIYVHSNEVKWIIYYTYLKQNNTFKNKLFMKLISFVSIILI